MIGHWPDGVDYTLFVDENNHPNLLKQAIRLTNAGDSVPLGERFFTVTGCAIDRECFVNLRDFMLDVKNKHWNEGLYWCTDSGSELRVCFHSNEIRRKEKAFALAEESYQELMNDLASLLTQCNYTVFSATVDLEAHARRYIRPSHPYNLAINFILERFGKFFLRDSGKTGIVVFEGRGPKEDRGLLGHCLSVLDDGTGWASSEELSTVKSVFFNPKLTDDLKMSYVGLELADLVSYPIFNFHKTGIRSRPFEIIEPKLYGYPNHIGRGLKTFPR